MIFRDTRVSYLIINQAQRIDGKVNQLDRRWIESEILLTAIRKHYSIYTAQEPWQNGNFRAEKDLSGPLPGRKRPSFRNELLIEEVQGQRYSILDNIDALIYVSDMEAYEILFLNQQGLA